MKCPNDGYPLTYHKARSMYPRISAYYICKKCGYIKKVQTR